MLLVQSHEAVGALRLRQRQVGSLRYQVACFRAGFQASSYRGTTGSSELKEAGDSPPLLLRNHPYFTSLLI